MIGATHLNNFISKNDMVNISVNYDLAIQAYIYSKVLLGDRRVEKEISEEAYNEIKSPTDYTEKVRPINVIQSAKANLDTMSSIISSLEREEVKSFTKLHIVNKIIAYISFSDISISF